MSRCSNCILLKKKTNKHKWDGTSIPVPPLSSFWRPCSGPCEDHCAIRPDVVMTESFSVQEISGAELAPLVSYPAFSHPSPFLIPEPSVLLHTRLPILSWGLSQHAFHTGNSTAYSFTSECYLLTSNDRTFLLHPVAGSSSLASLALLTCH